MPAHTVASADLAAEVDRIEAEGGKIVAVTPAGEGAFVVITSPSTRRKAGEKETR